MSRILPSAALIGCALLVATPCFAQESTAATTTRKKLQQKVTVDFKEVGTKALFDELNLELDKPLKFTIDNKSGVSNNSKMSYKGKDVTVEKVLNDLAEKFDFGWAVISNASNNRVDGSIVIRKTKEKGYEAGKEPKKGAAQKQSAPPALTQLELHAGPTVHAHYKPALIGIRY
jgi:hypothetical protein